MKHFTKILALLAGLGFGIVTADAATHLRQSDAVEVVIGPFVDATDGVTAETALTITSSEVFIKKCTAAGDCAVSAAKNEATSATHDGRGYYEVDFDTTDTNTVGTLYLSVAESGAAPVWAVFEIVEEAVFDRDYAASATGLVGTAQTGDSFARIGAAGAGLTAIPDLDELKEALVLTLELTADSGTTSTLVDAALTEATNNWFAFGAAAVFTSGTLARQVRCITGFTASSDTLRWAPLLTTAVTTHNYYLIAAPGCAILGNP